MVEGIHDRLMELGDVLDFVCFVGQEEQNYLRWLSMALCLFDHLFIGHEGEEGVLDPEVGASCSKIQRLVDFLCFLKHVDFGSIV